MPGGVVIVGAGQGGFQVAASLRQEGYEGPVTLIGAEAGLPYQRPPLSKAFLKDGKAEALALRPASFYEKKEITLVPETRVTGIDRDAQAVVTEVGARHEYDHLILATGTRNMRPAIPGLDRALDLRTLGDAHTLRDALDRPRRCAVIGGGFIGLEFASVARDLGHEVAVIEAMERLMSRVVSPKISERFAAMHRARGTQLHLGQAAAEVDAGGVTLADGSRIDADLVLIAAGVAPVTDLAAEAGLAVSNGIVTDAQLCTDDPAISALGDCATFPERRSGRMVRLESVQAATDHARAIAKRLVHGTGDAYAAVPWFWSDQCGAKLQIAGLAVPEDDTVIAPDGTVLRFDGETLTAVETIDAPKVHMRARKLLAGGAPPSRDALRAVDDDLTAL